MGKINILPLINTNAEKEPSIKPKISFFLSHPVQYISPLLKELALVCELHVYYFSDASIKGFTDKGFGQKIKWDVPLLEGYDSTFIKNYSFSNSLSNKFLDLINPGIIKYLFKDKSKIIVLNGWSYFSDLLTIITAKFLRKKVWIRAENPLSQENKNNKLKIILKKTFLKYFLFKFFVDGFLYIGKQNKLFFQYYGVKEKDLIYTPYAVDNLFFSSQYELYKNDIDAIKKSLNIPLQKKIILFSGKYISKKRPLDLLKAFYDLHDDSSLLIMLGDGELRPQMEAFINKNKSDNIILTGFINQSSISKYYAIADVFVMCSGIGETWGLSVNEAMNFSKPVIVSSTTGCSSDLVKNEENGFVFEEGNTESLKNYLQKIIADDKFRKRAGEISSEIIKQYSIPVIVKNIYNKAISVN